MARPRRVVRVDAIGRPPRQIGRTIRRDARELPPRHASPVVQSRRRAERPAKRSHIGRKLTIALAAFGLVYLSLFTPRTTPKTIRPKAVSVARKYSQAQTVCIDAGHGGADPGASSNDGTITERDINLTVAQKVATSLEAAGYQVYLTRTTNAATLSNHDRYSYCNNLHASIMVSIHHNYFTDTTVDYDTALFYKDSDQALATSILNASAGQLGITNDGISQFEDGVLSESMMPAALSESFFITSGAEYRLLGGADSRRLADEAQGIAAGIVSYFTQPKTTQVQINSHPQVINRDEAGN